MWKAAKAKRRVVITTRLSETGAPFIFMNSANTFRDLTTMVHEGGHAVHTFLTADLELNDFKHCPTRSCRTGFHVDGADLDG